MSEFVNCACCRRCTPRGEGLCVRCKPSSPGGDDGCRPAGYGAWKRNERCRVRTEVARRADEARKPDARNTGRQQGTRKTVRCRFCTRRFPVWTRSKRTGKRVSWQPAIRTHCQRQHAYEVKEWRVSHPLEMITPRSDDREQRRRMIQEAAMRSRRGR